MSLSYNDNTYEVLKRCKWNDMIFEEHKSVEPGDSLGSFAVNNIIITKQSEVDQVIELDGDDYIDMMVSLGYVKVVT